MRLIKKYKITFGQISAGGLFLLKRKMTNISLNIVVKKKLKLYSSTGALVDSIKYSGSIKENLAYAKQDGAFFWTTTPTPEKENINQRGKLWHQLFLLKLRQ
jgi:hypothetical protein